MDFDKHPLDETRRQFLGRMATGAGSLALASLLHASGANASIGGTLPSLHTAPRVKRVIHLCMAGGPSHLESFDYKPKLAKMDGEPMPASVTQGQPIAQLQGQRTEMLWARSTRFRSTANRNKRFRRCSRTSAASLTTSASSARCTRSRSTTIPLTRS
jgi:hypothetical protein